MLEEVSGPFEVMGNVARTVPLAALCVALGASEDELDGAVADASFVGRRYLSGEEAVLAQACEATAALIGNALVLTTARPELCQDVRGLLEATLRSAAPLRVMKRVSSQGEPVVLDLEAAYGEGAPNARPLAFGTGVRPCPGEQEALALAAGVLEALLLRCAAWSWARA